MAAEYGDYYNQAGNDSTLRIRNLEEKQRILKNQALLIGKNLIEIREKSRLEILEMKKEIEIMRGNVERLTSFLKTASEEFSEFARKDDVEILKKQMRMFEPFIKEK